MTREQANVIRGLLRTVTKAHNGERLSRCGECHCAACRSEEPSCDCAEMRLMKRARALLRRANR